MVIFYHVAFKHAWTHSCTCFVLVSFFGYLNLSNIKIFVMVKFHG